MRLVLFEPDIPQNAGAMIRLTACLGVALDIIEPCGFVLDDRRLRRVAMDYGGASETTRHASWTGYARVAREGRLVLLSTRAETRYTDYAYREHDSILVGRESGGVPVAVRDACDAAVVIPMAAGLRSLNVVTAAAMVLGEAVRQTRWSPPGSSSAP